MIASAVAGPESDARAGARAEAGRERAAM